MTKKELLEIIKDADDNIEIFIRSKTFVGNIVPLTSVEKSTYGFFGEKIPCIILDRESDND